MHPGGHSRVSFEAAMQAVVEKRSCADGITSARILKASDEQLLIQECVRGLHTRAVA